jgi:hypothetical protein
VVAIELAPLVVDYWRVEENNPVLSILCCGTDAAVY